MKYKNFTLGQIEALINKHGGEEGTLQFLRDEKRVDYQPKPPLLISLPPIQIPALDRFVVEEQIKVGVGQTAYISPNFHNDFGGMIEETLAASVICPYQITGLATYAEMRKELGEGKVVRATLGQIRYLATTGGLLSDGRANLFEVLDKNGVARLVRVRWYRWHDDFGWSWYSYPVDYSSEWYAARRVFSGNSRPETLDAQTPA